MACRFEVTLASEDADRVGAARTALDAVDEIEAALSLFRDSSELVRLNRAAASVPVPVSAGLMALLGLCRDLHAATGGAFDPTSTPTSRAWGFLTRQVRQPSPEQIEAARARVGMERVTLDRERGTVSFDAPGVELNLGAIGKGWALDRIAAGLQAVGLDRGLVSAGGSSFLGWGREAWPVALAPGRRHLAELWLEGAALGTSGVREQYLDVDGRRLGHVIDPRTGWPAKGVLSASVVACEAATADALATAFLAGGLTLAREWCAGHPGTLALLVLEDDPGTLLQLGSSDRVQVEPAAAARLATEA